jgi:FAD-dependent urate hydroxylase
MAFPEVSAVAVEEAQRANLRAATSRCDVAVVGAGPYGLAAGARLRELRGLDVRVFGKPMSFWESMPMGMLLRSAWESCHIGYPSGELTLDAYKASSARDFGKPVPLDVFVDYGRWFQHATVPDVDERRVELVENVGEGFVLRLDDGEVVRADRVVVAAGIAPFAWVPPVFRDLPSELVTHTSAHRDLSAFAGKRVAVVGGGQSALESAALLHESGAAVEVIARADKIIWLRGGTIQRKLGRAKPLFYAQTDVGPAGLSRLVAVPALFRRLPRPAQARIAHRSIRPAGARWLVDRLAKVPIKTGLNVVEAAALNSHVRLSLDDGSQREVEHVIHGTGYRVDAAGYDFLAPALVDQIRRVGGYPVLTRGLESSVPGLHFLGAPAAWSFGPIMRFVSGTWYAAESLQRAVRHSSGG